MPATVFVSPTWYYEGAIKIADKVVAAEPTESSVAQIVSRKQ